MGFGEDKPYSNQSSKVLGEAVAVTGGNSGNLT
jgi:hypothetical protein